MINYILFDDDGKIKNVYHGRKILDKPIEIRGSEDLELLFDALKGRHNDSGPAVIYYRPDGSIDCEEYCLNGELIGEDLNLYTKEAIENYLIIK